MRVDIVADLGALAISCITMVCSSGDKPEFQPTDSDDKTSAAGLVCLVFVFLLFALKYFKILCDMVASRHYQQATQGGTKRKFIRSLHFIRISPFIPFNFYSIPFECFHSIDRGIAAGKRFAKNSHQLY